MLDPTPFRELFPVTRRAAFFNHAGVSALNTRAVEAMTTFIQQTSERPFTELFPQFLEVTTDLRQRIATLINARSPDEIVLMPNTATAVNTVATSLPFRPGDNVLLLDTDYPANIYPWMNQSYRGVLHKMVPQRNGGLDIDVLASRIDAHTRAIALSTVQFASGVRNDIQAVGQLCRERGIYLSIDGIQSLGALPIDVQAANIDFLSCGSQKWLLGPFGSGFLYVRRERLDELMPGAYVGASSVLDAMNYTDYNLSPLPTSERFAIGTPNIAGTYGLHASLSLIQEVGIEQVAERVLSLASLAIEELRGRGFAVSPSGEYERRSGIVIAEIDNPMQVTQRLEQQGIIVIPRGNGVRIAPHFYNTEDEIRQAVEALTALRQAG